MDAFSASLMADKREIIFAPTVYKFQTFAQMAEEFKLNERDVVLTNEFIYTPFMKDLGLKCHYVFQEKFGAGEPSEEMIQVMYDAIPYDSYDRVIAVGGGAIMDLCKLLGCKRPDTVHNLYFKRFPVVHEKDVKWSKHSRQTVEIHYNDIGCVDTQADEAKSGLESA